MRVKFFVLSVLMGLVMKAGAQQPTGGTLTLQQSIETAVKNNTTVKQSEYLMESAGIIYKQAKTNMLPDLIGNVNHGINQGRSIDPFTNSYINQQVNFASYNLSSSVTVFNGFQLLNNLRAQSLNYDAAKLELQQNKDNITLLVILSYLQVLSTQEQLTQAINQADLSRKQVERLETLNKQGAIPPSQLYDLRGQLANDELSIVNSRNQLDASKLSLARLMNVPFDKDLQLQPLSADELSLVYEGDVESIYNNATSQLAIVKAAELRKRGAQRSLASARGAYSPLIFLSANLNTNYSSAASTQTLVNIVDVSTNDYVLVNGTKFNVVTPQSNFSSQKISYGDQFKNNRSSSFGVGIRIPIINSFLARNQVSQAKINLRNAEFLAQSTQTQLRQSIEEAYFNMRAAQDRYKAIRDQVAAYQESFRIAEVRFNAGLGTSVDYLIAKNNLDRANINLVTARYDYALRTRVLDYYQSKPLF
ncbi:MAG TPA: TolC family protein [Chitinophagaceae bacterium]|nr:TolC family protein [Chitinophagaceae bacterium]